MIAVFTLAGIVVLLLLIALLVLRYLPPSHRLSLLVGRREGTGLVSVSTAGCSRQTWDLEGILRQKRCQRQKLIWQVRIPSKGICLSEVLCVLGKIVKEPCVQTATLYKQCVTSLLQSSFGVS